MRRQPALFYGCNQPEASNPLERDYIIFILYYIYIILYLYWQPALFYSYNQPEASNPLDLQNPCPQAGAPALDYVML